MAPRRRKKTFRWRLKLWLFRIRHIRSPLNVRRSLARLRHDHDRPVLAFLQLLNPFPSWKFPVPDPIPSQDMVGNLELEETRRAGLVNLRAIPLWRLRDTPLRSLYRMYEAMASGEYGALGPETEYFWYQRSWTLQGIPDPKDGDPVRYAIIACLAEELVVAFNWRLSLGMRRNRKHIIRETDADPYPPYDPVSGPSWTGDVAAITPENLIGFPTEYVSGEGMLVLEEGGLNQVFALRNIVTNVGWLYTI